MSDNILDRAIEKLGKQEEKLLSNIKEAINQWRGNLLVFAGLAIAALSNQNNAWAYLLIVFWLVEAAFIVFIFYNSRNVYDLMQVRHFEGIISEEQEQNDLKYAERKHRKVTILDKISSLMFFAIMFLTLLYFFVKILEIQGIIIL